MDSDTFQRMSFEEACGAMIITKKLTDPDEIEIVERKNEWIKNFQPLLKYVIEGAEDKKIDSKDLGELWLFYVDGLNIRRLFTKLSQNQITKILENQVGLENILDDDCKEMVECGVFLYQTAYYIVMSKLKLEESLIRYKTIYTGDDPILWVKNNDNSWKLKIFNKQLNEKGGILRKLWERLYKVSNLSLDPIFQN
jgi:hypothetical protein